MKLGKKGSIIIILVVVGLLLLSVIVTSGVLLFFVLGRENEVEDTHEPNMYQLSNLNPSKKETNFGFVTISRELSEKEYISYHNSETGITSIISNFFDQEYECTGSCWCEEEEERRYSSAASRSVFIVFAAMSTSLAVNIAGETFKNTCEDSLINVCAKKKKVKSKVENCAPVDEPTELPVDEEGAAEKEPEDDRMQKRQYSCQGYCVESVKDDFFGKTFAELQESGFDVKASQKLTPPCGEMVIGATVDITVQFSKVSVKASNQQAKEIFMMKYLNSYCDRQSVMNVVGASKNLKISKCTSIDDAKMKNVKCKLIGKEFV